MPGPQSSKSINWYNHFIDNLPVAIMRTTPEGRVVFCNKPLLDLFGYQSKEAFMNRPIIHLYQDKRDRGFFIQSLNDTEFVKDIIIGFKKKNGTPIWCSVTSKTIKDDDGTIEFIDSIVRDITGELGTKTNTIQLSTLENTNVSFFLKLDEHGIIKEINTEEPALFSYSETELIGHNLADFLTPKDSKTFHETLSGIAGKGKSNGLFSLVSKNNDIKHIEYHARYIPGEPAHIDMIARDITELVTLQRTQMERQKLQGVLEMAGGVSHRLNQPLTIINNIINEIASDIDDSNNVYPRFSELQSQLAMLNDIVKKIGNIKKYASMNYVGGIRIVDIDKAT